jgi:hypothetical protein
MRAMAVKYICFDRNFEIKRESQQQQQSYTIFGQMAILLSLYGLLQFIILVIVSLAFHPRTLLLPIVL